MVKHSRAYVTVESMLLLVPQLVSQSRGPNTSNEQKAFREEVIMCLEAFADKMASTQEFVSSMRLLLQKLEGLNISQQKTLLSTVIQLSSRTQYMANRGEVFRVPVVGTLLAVTAADDPSLRLLALRVCIVTTCHHVCTFCTS